MPYRLHCRQILFLGARVRGVRGNQVERPAKQPAGSDPEARRDDEPEDPAKKIAVVNLPDTRNEEAEHRRNARVISLGHMRKLRQNRVVRPIVVARVRMSAHRIARTSPSPSSRNEAVLCPRSTPRPSST